MADIEAVSYRGWKNCLKLSDGRLELIVTLDVGPRVIRLGTPGGKNLFKEFDDQVGRTSGAEWISFGGHRLWHAPEIFPRSYAPDFSPVSHSWNAGVLTLVQNTEPETGIQKEIRISFRGETVELTHRLINRNAWAIEVAPWCLSVMAAGGRALLPQEEFRSHPETLEPARPMVLWHFTRMNDPRFTWGDRLIQIREDASCTSKQKIGVQNRQGWVAYQLGGDLFLKTVPRIPGAVYPDMGCNCEIFTMPGFLEVETLGPLAKLEPNGFVDHLETWRVIHGGDWPEEEPALIKALNPILSEYRLPAIEA